MKIKNFILSFTTSIVLAACVSANAKPDVDNEHRILVYKDCQKIKDIKMTPEQIAAYQALKKSETKLKELEVPLQKMEHKMSEYGHRMEQLSEQMVHETNEKIVVDRNLVRKQREIANEMREVVREHEIDIRKIEQEARAIEQVARRFEKQISFSINAIEHDHIRIVSGEQTDSSTCYTSSKA